MVLILLFLNIIYIRHNRHSWVFKVVKVSCQEFQTIRGEAPSMK